MGRIARSVLVLCLLQAVAQGQWIVVDNADAEFHILSGTWTPSVVASGYWGANYLYRSTTAGGSAFGEVEWRPNLPSAGMYCVAVNYTEGANRADNAAFTVFYQGGSDVHPVNQQDGGGAWLVLGTYPFEAGAGGSVRLSNEANPSCVIADAVRFRDMTHIQAIPHSDPRVEFGGLFFADVGADAVYLNRFSVTALAATDPSRALDTTGVTVRFRTNSPHVQADFIELPSLNLGDEFGVYRDGVFDRSVTGLTAEADSHDPGAFVTYELACPSYARVAFTGLEIDADAELLPVPSTCRPRYAAFGDSITHGFGQHPSSYLTYPWLLAASKRWELFNLAVSGSRVIPELGAMLDAESLDVVTVLWGQNDWNAQNNLPLFESRYGEFLDNLRLHHPTVPIYCITLIASTSATPSVDHGYSRDDYRQVVRDIVSSRVAAGDGHIHVIEGDTLTTTGDLADGVHLSVSGAANFATRLTDAIAFRGPPRTRVDFDDDCDADLNDFTFFRMCFNGPNRPVPYPECALADLDDDNDVDLSDFAVFRSCFNGPNRTPACQ